MAGLWAVAAAAGRGLKYEVTLEELRHVGQLAGATLMDLLSMHVPGGGQLMSEYVVERLRASRGGTLLPDGGGVSGYLREVLYAPWNENAGDDGQLLHDLLTVTPRAPKLANCLYAMLVRRAATVLLESHRTPALGLGGDPEMAGSYEYAMCTACSGAIAVIEDAQMYDILAFDGELVTGAIADANVAFGVGAVDRWLCDQMRSGNGVEHMHGSFRSVLLGRDDEFVPFGTLEGLLCMPDHELSDALRLRLMRAQVVAGKEWLDYEMLVYGPGPLDFIDFEVYEFVHGVFDVENHAWQGGIAPAADVQEAIFAAIQAVYDSHVPRMLAFAKELVLQDPSNKYAWGYLHLVGNIQTYVDVRGQVVDVEGAAMQHFDASYARSSFGRTYWTVHLHEASKRLIPTSRAQAINRLGRVPAGANRVFVTLLSGAQRLSDNGVLPADLGDVEVWHAIFALLSVRDVLDL